jgi:hypothetical protein
MPGGGIVRSDDMLRLCLIAGVALCLAAAGLVQAARYSAAIASPEPSLSAIAAGAASPDDPTLDYQYFKTKVEPIFLKKRPGHARCVSCHAANHVRLHLVALTPGSKTWNEEQSKENFELVKAVAIPGDLKSPILVHPLTQDAGGDFFHSGGKHFNSQNDPEWLTLKAFVMGKTAGGQ